MDHKSQYTKSYLHNRDWVHTVNWTVLKLPASQTITARQPENDSAHAHMDVHTHTLKRRTKKKQKQSASGSIYRTDWGRKTDTYSHHAWQTMHNTIRDTAYYSKQTRSTVPGTVTTLQALWSSQTPWLFTALLPTSRIYRCTCFLTMLPANYKCHCKNVQNNLISKKNPFKGRQNNLLNTDISPNWK